ncbi:uncharacterized protein LOC143429581 [Xylocopa sonorina]|uniref:uncharacterized protein LOC143429581 n=1 Tax=Xylocopa sonorina TaxID=1818115 RepID=UPI00403B263E
MALGIPSWLNVDFTERILRLAEDDNTVQVIDIFTKAATAKGDNYTSDMIRVTVDFTRIQGVKNGVNEKKSFIFKFEPIESGTRQDLVQKIQLFDTEISMMTTTLNKMSDMLNCRLCARVYHVRMERPLCLIMEDLAVEGFRMADRQAGLDLTHSMLTIRSLAKFHAASVALCEKEPKHKSMYRNGFFRDEYPKEMSQFIEYACQGLISAIENWDEIDNSIGVHSYAEKLRKLLPVIYSKGVAVTKRDDEDFNVINHGDCWVNNLLFRYDENSKPIQHIFVDFQLAVYTSPAIDLHYFFNTSLNENVYDNHANDLYEEYLRVLAATMKQLGCKTKPLTMEGLHSALEKRRICALVASISILPLILVDKGDVRDISELMDEESMSSHPGFNNLLYRKIITKRLQKFDEMGMLDL